MSDRQGIEIDYCPECRGIWLDRGELDKIIERSSMSATQRFKYDDHDSKQHSHDSRNYDYHKKKKKGGLLGELFDF
jgi:Zn-finger nucleic acid-binding protein